MTVVAALLAAGGGTRFEGPTHKLLAPLEGRPVWEWALSAVLAAGFGHLVLVTGAVELALPDPLPDPAGTTVHRVHNPDWATGQAGSVLLAAATADRLGADHLVVGLADQPFVTTDAWRTVAGASADCRIVVAEYDGVPGPHPVRLARAVWPHLPTEGDQGARELFRAHPDWLCRVACLGSGADIDTTEDLHRWKSC